MHSLTGKILMALCATLLVAVNASAQDTVPAKQIGRASCRERVSPRV